MTIVPARREAKPAQARVLAARRAYTGSVSSPRLARGRDEKLVRSRSPTPPRLVHSHHAAELLSPGDSMEYSYYNHARSPTSSIDTHTTTYTYRATPTPSVSNASVASPGPSTQAWRKRSFSESQYSEITSLTDDHASDRTSAGPSISESYRLAPPRTGLPFDPSRDLDPEPSQTVSPVFQPALPAIKSDIWRDRQPMLAPWPAGKPRDNGKAAERVEPAPEKRKGIKTPYTSQEKKDKVKAVRENKACMRCVIFRQACEVLAEGQTCKACRVRSRKWHIPCTKMWLKSRWVYLVPESFFDHLKPCNEHAFPRYPPANRSPAFLLKLVRDHGLELDISVFAVVGLELENDMFLKLTFGHGSAKTQRKPTLPLMPEHSSASMTSIERVVGDHMNKVSSSPGQHNLPEILFPQDKDHPWVRDVFDIVCKYQENVMEGQSVAIAFALRTIYVRFLIARTFYVPPREIYQMNKNLPKTYKLPDEVLMALADGDYTVCPKFVDRYIKASLYKLLKQTLLPKAFQALEELFHLTEKDHGKSTLSELSRAEAFCATVTVLLLAGQSQIKIMQSVSSRVDYNWNNVKEIPNGPENLKREAYHCIYEIEREVIDHLLDLFAYQFGKEKMFGEIKPQDEGAWRVARAVDPIGSFHNSRSLHADSLDRINPILDLNDTTADQFVSQNLNRVLLRLENKLWKPKRRR